MQFGTPPKITLSHWLLFLGYVPFLELRLAAETVYYRTWCHSVNVVLALAGLFPGRASGLGVRAHRPPQQHCLPLPGSERGRLHQDEAARRARLRHGGQTFATKKLKFLGRFERAIFPCQCCTLWQILELANMAACFDLMNALVTFTDD